MRIFLAGATGVIGRTLIPLLVRAGHEVIGASRKGPVRLDVLDADATRTAVRQARPDVVMHQLTDLSGFDFEANARLRILGTRHLVDAVKAVGVPRMIAQSVSFAYAPGTRPATEDEPLHIDAPPARRRTAEGIAALENAVAEMPEGVVLRYGTLYGAGTWYGPGGSIAEKLRAGQLPATPGRTSFLNVEDAASAALAALEWPAGIVNIVDDAPAAGTEWVPFLADLLRAPPPPGGDGQPWERGASNAKARGLGWQPHYASWRDGFRSVFS